MNTAIKLPVFETGIHHGIGHEAYHGTDAISNGYLKRLNECPAKAKVQQDDTPAFIIGRAIHCFVLEGEQAFNAEFVVAPEINKRTNAGKEEWAQFQADNEGKGIITPADLEQITEINNAVHGHPLSRHMLKGGISEVTAFWIDEATGFQCKCRPDRIPDGNKGVIIDLKTCEDASEQGFQRSIVKYGYYQQAAWYVDGVNKAGGKDFDTMAFIAVEKKPPYRTEVYVLDDEFIKAGRSQYEHLMQLEMKCREANFWPHYSCDGAIEIYKPSWMV